MPILNQWWTLTTEVIEFDPDVPGVYELGDSSGNVIYVGSAEKLKRRLKEHVNDQENPCIRASATKYRFEHHGYPKQREKELYDQHVMLNGKPPRCNRIAPTGY